MDKKIKPGPVQIYHFEDYLIGHEIKMPPLKQSSFKSMLSRFNKDLPREERHQYAYESLSKVILATRVR
jgi:hypothetical protein